jgi:hypothetical protein
MKTKLIILTLTAMIASCDTVDKKVDNIKLDSNGDTLEIVKHYPTDTIKEIVYYQKNRPVCNVGFYLEGDTITKPYAVFSKQDNNMFIFIPYNLKIESYDLIFGLDSGVVDAQIDRFHKLTDSLHQSLRHLTKSIDIKLDTAVINFGVSKGVLKCKMDTAGKVYKYWGFDLNNKNYP